MAPVFVVGCPRSGTHFLAELLLVREPAAVVNSLFVKGWYLDPVLAPPSYAPATNPFGAFFGS